ncbi:hypothetical protein HMPREF1002_04590 [Porphyromonas sp. 31_2]|nr:hypothetical protein HMPREF1002_04590 [Porphyromonas sp. 31_2]
MPAKRLFGIISIIFLFVTCISCKSSTDLSEEKRILVIQSYEKHFPAYEKMKEIMSSELRKKGIHASVYSFIWIVSNIRRSNSDRNYSRN